MIRHLLLAAALAAAAQTAPAQTDDAGTFSVTLGGIRAGILAFSGRNDGRTYAAVGELRSSGLLAMIREISYDARSSGRVTPSGFVPVRYEESANTGERVSKAVMDYVSGVPQVKVYEPPQERKPRDVDPATQGGTLDPMTTMYLLLRDVPKAETCALDVFMFDGRRRSQLVTEAPEEDGDTIVCAGEYRRVAGFSTREMKKKSVFPFRLTYTHLGDGRYRVTRVVFDTLYGRAALNRR